MLFTDPLFLFYFLPVTLALLRCITLSGRHLTNGAKVSIIAATLVFYAYENWLWVPLFLFIVGGSYGFGWILAHTTSLSWRRIWLVASLVHCLFFLSVFKYLNWAADIWPALQPLHAKMTPLWGSNGAIILPPGISFYVFEAISFCFDIFRKKILPPKNPLDFFCFIAMFPRFIAGPIVRYVDLDEQIKRWAGLRVSQGLTLFSLGFSIKCLFADQFAVFVPYAFNVDSPDFAQAWTGVFSYSFQLYFDFWSYSIMATGLGLCLGFEFPDNFKSPYHAHSITEFWQRWHISLSSWLRDYVYIPLGGNRSSTWRTYLNLLLTMLVGGLWHGASVTFIIWGGYHGLLLALERLLKNFAWNRSLLYIRKGGTLLLVVLGWSLFRSANLDQFLAVGRGLVGINGLAGKFNPLLLEKNILAGLLSFLGLAFWLRAEKWLVTERPLAQRNFSTSVQWACWLIFLLSLLLSTSNSEIPFLYFQF